MRTLTPILLLAALLLSAPATAGALELGWQDQRAVMAPDAPIAFAAGAALGARTMRLIIPWADVQPTSSSWDWQRYDVAVDQARAAGFNVQLVLGGIGSRPPAWAGHDNNDPDGFGSWRLISDTAYLRFVAGAASHFTGRITRWSILGEVDLTGYPAARYARLFTRARAAIRHFAGAGARVLFGEFSAARAISYTLAALAHVHRALIADGFAIHPYGNPRVHNPDYEVDFARLPVLKRLLGARATRHVLSTPSRGRLAIYATEYGCPVDLGADVCATRWAAALAGAARLGLRELVAYQVFSDAGPGVKWNTSLVDAEGAPRPAFTTIARAAGARS